MPNLVDAYAAITGNWNDALVWSDGAPPGSFSPIRDAAIAGSGTAPYTLSVTDTQHAGTVTLNDSVAILDVLGGGSLLLGGGVDPASAATLDLTSGILSLVGTIGSSVATPLTVQEHGAATNYNGGTFSDVILVGALDLSQDGADLISTGGLQVVNPTTGSPGIITITGDAALLEIVSTETLSDVALTFGSAIAATAPEVAVNIGAVLTIDGTSSVSLRGAATFSGAGSLVLDAGLSVASGGALNLTIATTENDSTINAGFGTVNVNGALTGSGTITTAAATSGSPLRGTIDLASTVSATQTIALTSGSKLILDAPGTTAGSGAVAAQITGLASQASGGVPANTIDLTHVAFTQTLVGSVTGGVMTITDGGTLEATLNTAGIADGSFVAFSADPTVTGTDVNVACYCPGTAIRTPAGEVAVELLAIGDMVVTAFGATEPVRWIGRRSYAGRFARGNKTVLPIRISAGALADGVPCRDLWVSPKHALLLDGVLIPAEVLINGRSIVQMQEVASVEYFHIELNRHDILIAEGAAAESFVDDNSRGMFHNVHEHAALYPDARRVPARYCAPRLEDGEQVEAVRRRLASRADPAVLSGHADFGALHGSVDLVAGGRLYGWAQHAVRPHHPSV